MDKNSSETIMLQTNSYDIQEKTLKNFINTSLSPVLKAVRKFLPVSRVLDCLDFYI